MIVEKLINLLEKNKTELSFLFSPLILVSLVGNLDNSKIQINSFRLVAESFVFEGTKGSVQVLLQIWLNIPKEIELSSVFDWSGNAIKWKDSQKFNIQDGGSLHVRLQIKKQYAESHIFSNKKSYMDISIKNVKILNKTFSGQTTSITPNGECKLVLRMKNEIVTNFLIFNSFQVSGANGSGVLTIKEGITIRDQVNIIYAKKIGNKDSSSSYYLDVAPSSLSNGDQVYIKFAIKNDYKETHKLPLWFKNQIVFTINGLNPIESPKFKIISESKSKISFSKVNKQVKKIKLSKELITEVFINSILSKSNWRFFDS